MLLYVLIYNAQSFEIRQENFKIRLIENLDRYFGWEVVAVVPVLPIKLLACRVHYLLGTP